MPFSLAPYLQLSTLKKEHLWDRDYTCAEKHLLAAALNLAVPLR
jgi:hypothetical protein